MCFVNFSIKKNKLYLMALLGADLAIQTAKHRFRNFKDSMTHSLEFTESLFCLSVKAQNNRRTVNISPRFYTFYIEVKCFHSQMCNKKTIFGPIYRFHHETLTDDALTNTKKVRKQGVGLPCTAERPKLLKKTLDQTSPKKSTGANVAVFSQVEQQNYNLIQW